MVEIDYRNGQVPSPEVQEGMVLALKLAANCTHGEMGWQVDKGPWINPCPNFAAYVGEIDDIQDLDCVSLIEEVSSDLTLMIDYLHYARTPTQKTRGKFVTIKNGRRISPTPVSVIYNSTGTVRSKSIIYRLCGGNWVIYYRLPSGVVSYDDDERGENMSIEYKKAHDVVFEGSQEDFLHDLFMYRLTL